MFIGKNIAAIIVFYKSLKLISAYKTELFLCEIAFALAFNKGSFSIQKAITRHFLEQSALKIWQISHRKALMALF